MKRPRPHQYYFLFFLVTSSNKSVNILQHRERYSYSCISSMIFHAHFASQTKERYAFCLHRQRELDFYPSCHKLARIGNQEHFSSLEVEMNFKESTFFFCLGKASLLCNKFNNSIFFLVIIYHKNELS